ncbi:GNAT family N-acetyltransferase [Alteribacter natronophilus]|uniref:GNAT family N-acetyltransferase n=1 Tax=Alteribacter natronophilus TaxID=2583810 RepID=UPI00110D79C6|nr:GNAT family N-acetyltransferase [Alteribacter natronophilus]TMW70299.1 GNAT family N-acetyltransferase [Alteribacter natronophilus]
MTFRRFTSAGKLLEHVKEKLEVEEAKHSLPLGILANLIKTENPGDETQSGDAPFLAANDRGTMTLIQTPPWNLIAAGSPEDVPAAVEWLKDSGASFPGITGEKELVKAFIQELNPENASVFMRQRIYRLDEVNPLPRQKGTFGKAEHGDLDLVTDWVMQFSEQALTPTSKEEARELAEHSISENRLYLWKNEEGTPVSMAKKARETAHGASVNLVFTPDEYKRQGYATSCVAALSELLLSEGFHFCSLYTDLDNPVSNSIYTKIGYRPVADSVDYRFNA